MSELQVPRGPEKMKCPLWRKPMSEVCHTCPMWTFVRTEDPRVGQAVDKWDCALAWGPILTIDLIRRQDRTTASVDKVANVLDDASGRAMPAIHQPSGPLTIGDGRG
jgi:hypothetical protein